MVQNEWINSFGNNKLELIIFVTEKCNFRCLYCYEDFKFGKISTSVVKGIKSLIMHRISGLDNLTLSFFGGEPLLNKSFVLEFSKWAKDICLLKNVNYSYSITTNGYLLSLHLFNLLVKNGISNFQITIDGDSKIHDELRPMYGNKGTFDMILKNLRKIKSTNLSFQLIIRFNICDYNLNSVGEFIEKYSQFFSNDSRFKFHFHPIFGMNEFKLKNLKMLQEVKNNAIKRSLFLFEEGEETVCYASKANSFVIRANGKIQKCTVALDNEINNIGQITESGDLEIENEKLKKWILSNNKACPLSSIAIEKNAIPYEKAGKYLISGESA